MRGGLIDIMAKERRARYKEMLHDAEKKHQIAQFEASGSQRSPGLLKRILVALGFSSYESESEQEYRDRTG